MMPPEKVDKLTKNEDCEKERWSFIIEKSS
jgi:hypothetical protein